MIYTTAEITVTTVITLRYSSSWLCSDCAPCFCLPWRVSCATRWPGNRPVPGLIMRSDSSKKWCDSSTTSGYSRTSGRGHRKRSRRPWHRRTDRWSRCRRSVTLARSELTRTMLRWTALSRTSRQGLISSLRSNLTQPVPVSVFCFDNEGFQLSINWIWFNDSE